ncbi:MAG: PASTA domain-containing protein [Desulfobacterales bacterium]
MIRTLLKYLAVLIIFCVIAGLSAFFTLSFMIKSGDTVVVPELEGKNAIAALEMLTDLGLNTKVKGLEYSDDIPRNHIMHQNPSAGGEIKKNRDVTVVISKGAKTATLPDLKGQQADRAEIILEDNGLDTGNISRTYSRRAAKDTVIAQSPAAGKTIRRATPVHLLVSAGPRPESFQMPDLKDNFLDEAMLAIEKHRMRLGDIKYLHDPAKPENAVLGQAPPAGYRVEEGKKIRLMVNRKPGTRKRDAEENRVLFSYRIAPGFLKQHIRLEMNCFGTQLTVYDGLVKPDTLIWAVIPQHVRGAVFLYQNDELVKSEIYN